MFNSPNDVLRAPRRDVSMAAGQDVVRPSILTRLLSTRPFIVNLPSAWRGWLGGVMVLGKFPVPGRPSNLAEAYLFLK